MAHASLVTRTRASSQIPIAIRGDRRAHLVE
jgi:hypothetical protein